MNMAFRAGLGAANLGAKAARDAVRAAFVAGRTAGGMLPHRRKR